MTNHRPSDAPTDEISQDEYIRRLRRQCDMEASHIAELKEQVRTIALERDAAREKVAKIMAGLEGCCMTCEPVGVRNQQMERDIETLKDQISSLRTGLWIAIEQRDEARRSLCECRASGGFDSHDGDWFADDGRHILAREYAAEQGWDCYKEERK